ncbi:MAG: beta-N-acetylglucosaminidase domain-containing protein [Armatimonadetes bacterium]|nr:beta-N-acetylglucosaminidase domain-containing protein [Armatimonadota bacterium]
MFLTATTLVVLAVLSAGGQQAASKAQQQSDAWPYAYTGHLLPPPQEMTSSDEVWKVADAGSGQAQAVIVLGPQAPAPEVAAAQELADRISHPASGVKVPIVRDVSQAMGAATMFSLGTTSTSPFNAQHEQEAGVAPVNRPEGYFIACRRHQGGFGGVLAIGADPVGTYWASKTLQQLLERRGDQVVFHPATVRDWPAFQLRSFKSGGRDWPRLEAAARWCANARFNCYNICYTSIGADQWPDPSKEYEDFVARATRIMRAKGLDCMPFVNPYYLWKEHIEVSDPSDLEALVRTCSLGPAAGGGRVMLCLDDFASKPVHDGRRLYKVRSPRDVAKFGDDLAAVNVAMVKYLWDGLRRQFPDVRLYVVPPYYWNPQDGYKEGGEEYLRKLGAGIPKEVRIVWTGPRVRSTAIDEASIEYYQGLVGRKVMLWDNTLYARHNPPHYLFDAFTTKYPPRFWELISPEVHYNAGASEIYRVGLLCAASYLWNPGAYDAEKVLRQALAAVGGSEAVEPLLAFRDGFYAFWDEYLKPFGWGDQMVKKVKSAKQRWLDEAEIKRIEGMVADLQGALARVKQTCRNKALADEVQAEANRFLPYGQAMQLMRKLPPPEAALVENLVANPGGEEVSDGRPVGWALYTGAGKGVLRAASGAHSGKYCIELRATEPYDWHDGRKSYNIAAMSAETNGFTAGKAPAVQSLRIYYVSFWLRGDPMPVQVGFQGWRKGKTSADRVFFNLGLEPFTAPKEWTHYTGRFIVPADVVCGALKIGINGEWKNEQPPQGSVFVDDVYVGGKRPEAKE